MNKKYYRLGLHTKADTERLLKEYPLVTTMKTFGEESLSVIELTDEEVICLRLSFTIRYIMTIDSVEARNITELLLIANGKKIL